MNKLKMGQFIYDDSLVHRLDPRTKLLGCSLIICAVLINAQWPLLILYTGLITLALIMANLGLSTISTGWRKLRYLLLATFILQAFLTDGRPLLLIGRLHITSEGLSLGISTFLRLVIIYLSSSLLTATTSPVKLATGLEALLQPLGKVKVPTQQIAMIIGTSLRFVPTFIEEADILTKAQMSRGAPLKSKQLMVRYKALLAIIIPLLAASLQRASDLAIAMESRCYGGEANRIRLRSLQFQRRDFLALSLVVAVFVMAIVNKI